MTVKQYWDVPRIWQDETVFILAGGPSLNQFRDVDWAGRNIISINNSWEFTPYTSVLYFCDKKWWVKNGDLVKKDFKGQYIVTLSDVQDELVMNLKNTGRTGLETTVQNGIRHGMNSGYQAINLAFLFGARRIVLLGYDMKLGPNEDTHWHAGHGAPSARVKHQLNKVFLPQFRALVKPLTVFGVEVFNATPDSALTLWPERRLEECL